MEEILAKFKNETNTQENIFIYCRVSTDMQDISKQMEELYNYCKFKNLGFPLIENIYYDDNVSGYKTNIEDRGIMKILNKCDKKIIKGEKNIIIIPELSRIGRRISDLQMIVREFTKNKNNEIHDIKNNLIYDGVDLMSNIMLSMLSICSEMERDMISKRVKSAMNSEKVKAKLKARKNKCKDLNQDELLNDYKSGMTQYALSKKYGIANCQIKKYCERIFKEKAEEK